MLKKMVSKKKFFENSISYVNISFNIIGIAQNDIEKISVSGILNLTYLKNVKNKRCNLMN